MDEKVVHIGFFTEGLGRAAFVFGALKYERLFLAPLYTFAALHPADAIRPVPLFVTVVLKYLVGQVRRRRFYKRVATRRPWRSAPRVDANAGEIWSASVDGCRVSTTKGRPSMPSLAGSRCASPQSQLHGPFDREGQPFRLIASLEALGVLLSSVGFVPEDPDVHADLTTIPLGFTDNRGNCFTLNRFMSTKFPLGCLVMELAARMERAMARVV